MSRFYQRDIISVEQFDLEDIKEIFEQTNLLRDSHEIIFNEFSSALPRIQIGKILEGFTLTNLFYEPSTRTSSSFHAAMVKLGGNVIPINEVHYSSVIKGETLEDTIKTLEQYSDIIVLRHPEVGSAKIAADIASIPIINAGDGRGEHPTQALLDLFTIYDEKGRIDDLNITFVGDLLHGRTVHSLIKLLQLYNVKINCVSPESLKLPEKYAELSNIKYQTSNLEEVIPDSDVIYMTRVQKERLPDFLLAIEYDYKITPELMARAKKDMILMHPLPRVNELPKELDSDPRSVYFRQMKNGLFVRMALLSSILRPTLRIS